MLPSSELANIQIKQYIYQYIYTVYNIYIVSLTTCLTIKALKQSFFNL